MEVLRKICRAIVKPLCHLAALIIYRVRIEEIENVPKNSACSVCGNHVHALDAPVLLAVTNRKIRFMAKEELWKSIGFRFMAFVFYVFPVKRGKNDTDAINTSIKILKSNEILGIYPEGTRHGMDKGVTIAIYNNINPDKTCEAPATFQFSHEKIISNYNYENGSYDEAYAVNSDIDYFVDQLLEFAKGITNAAAHCIKKEFSFDINKFIKGIIERVI